MLFGILLPRACALGYGLLTPSGRAAESFAHPPIGYIRKRYLRIEMTVAFVLALTISLALCTNVIAQHCAEHEVLLGSEQIERTCHNHAYGVEALLAAEV